jgi:hypothetical protein
MFWKIRKDDRRFLEGFRLVCPLRGEDVDVAQCFACELLRSVSNYPPSIPRTSCARRTSSAALGRAHALTPERGCGA